MLNKELLMGSGSLEPVLSIYISPYIDYPPRVAVKLSSEETFYVNNTGETTIKFSEIDLTADILIRYNEVVELSNSNLMLTPESRGGGVVRAPSIMHATLRIVDRTQSARISLV